MHSDGIVKVTDADAVKIARYPRDHAMTGTHALPIAQALFLSGGSGAGEVKALDGARVLQAWTRPAPYGWAVGVGISGRGIPGPVLRSAAEAIAAGTPCETC